jgi:hypothetical protein
MVPSNLPIIGLGYQIGVGKDTVADLLCHEYRFIRLQFAWPLKAAVAAIFGWNVEDLAKQEFKKTVDPFWGITPRTALQQIGTDVMRKHYRDDIWVKSMENYISRINDGYYKGVVITDMRFKNEVIAIKSWGGKVVKVVRRDNPFTPPASESKHASELDLDDYTDWDYILANASSIVVLHDAVRNMCTQFGIV